MIGGKYMEELVKKARKGDKKAFTMLILEIKNELYKIAKTRITNEADIDDAIQETMIETYKSIKKLKIQENSRCGQLKYL